MHCTYKQHPVDKKYYLYLLKCNILEYFSER